MVLIILWMLLAFVVIFVLLPERQESLRAGLRQHELAAPRAHGTSSDTAARGTVRVALPLP